jgi:hypothetical protein
LSWGEGDFFRSQYWNLFQRHPPQKKISPETQYSCLLQGDGPISSDLNAATHFQKIKQTKKKKRKRKSPTKRSSRNPSIRVVIYNHWMHIWITQTSKSEVRMMMIKLISIDYLLKQIGYCDKTLKLSLWLSVSEKLMRDTTTYYAKLIWSHIFTAMFTRCYIVNFLWLGNVSWCSQKNWKCCLRFLTCNQSKEMDNSLDQSQD